MEEADLSEFGLSTETDILLPSPSANDTTIGRLQRIYSICSLDNLRWLLLRLLIAALAAIWLMATSVGAYFILYRLYMPTMQYEAPVYFVFDGLHPPAASVAFEKDFRLRPGIAYDYILDIGIPDIPGLSEGFGNFMATLELKEAQDTVRYSRPVLLPYRSAALRAGLTIVKLVPLLLGWAQERMDIRIILADAVIAPAHGFAGTLNVTLGAPKLPVYDARLLVTAHLTGLRYWLYHWRLTAAFLLIMGLFLCQLASTTLLLTLWVLSAHLKAQSLELDGLELNAAVARVPKPGAPVILNDLTDMDIVPDTDHIKED